MAVKRGGEGGGEGRGKTKRGPEESFPGWQREIYDGKLVFYSSVDARPGACMAALFMLPIFVRIQIWRLFQVEITLKSTKISTFYTKICCMIVQIKDNQIKCIGGQSAKLNQRLIFLFNFVTSL